MNKVSIRQGVRRRVAALATTILVVLVLPGWGLWALRGGMSIGTTAMFNMGALLRWRLECEATGLD